MTPPVARRIALYGYFGMGNIGNEGSLEAMLLYLRGAHPEASLRCFSVDPETVHRDHGITANRLMTARLTTPGSTARRGPVTVLRLAAGRAWDLPRTFWLMRHVDVLVVPGMGVLETRLLKSPLGLPYWLFLAVASCRIRGGRVALIGVGVEAAAHPVTRWLYRWTVRMADHVSFRDARSARAAEEMGAPGRPGTVHPDLAFRLPTPERATITSGRVVIGVMAFGGSPGDPDRSQRSAARYLDRMAAVVCRFVDDGRTVSLVVGDLADRKLCREIRQRALADRPSLSEGVVQVSEASTMSELMAVMAGADAVVASRFHNVIAALKLCLPTVAVGYSLKHEDLLEEFGLPGRQVSIESFEADELVDLVNTAVREQPLVEMAMKDALRWTEDRLAQHLRHLSEELLDQPG